MLLVIVLRLAERFVSTIENAVARNGESIACVNENGLWFGINMMNLLSNKSTTYKKANKLVKQKLDEKAALAKIATFHERRTSILIKLVQTAII